MLRIIQNFRIGTKLAIMSVLSILLIAGIIFAEMTGNASVRKANESAIAQQTIARDAVDAKASIRGMQVGVRDIRLAGTPADLQKAGDYVATRLRSVNGFAEEMLKLSRSQENRERIEKLRSMAGDYAKGAQQIAALRAEIFGIGATAGGELPAEAIAKAAKLNDEATRIAREVTLPIAAEIESLADKVVAFAKHKVEEENAAAAQEMSSTERTSLAIGLVAGLLLIATCVFSVFTIARPMMALSASMRELAEGNFAVILPGLGRKDEIGDVAQAVETFKVKAEEKARNEAEAKIRQDQIAAQQRKVPATLPLSFVTGVGYDQRSEKRTAFDGTVTTRRAATGALEDASIFLTAPIGDRFAAFVEFPMYETRAWEFTPVGQSGIRPMAVPAEPTTRPHSGISSSTPRSRSSRSQNSSGITCSEITCRATA